MGNLNISGREISIDSYNSTEYLFHTIYQGLEYLVNAASGGMALGKADIKIADYVKYSEDSLESLVKIARKIFSLNAKRKAIRKERLKEEENRQRRAEAAAEEQRQKGAEEERLKKEAERQRLEGDDSKDDELDSEDTAFDSEDTALDSEGTVDDSIGAGDNSEGNEADPKDAGDNLADAKPTIEVSKATTEVPEATTTTEDAKPKYVFPTDSKRITDILDGKDHKGIDIGATKNDVGGDPVRAPVSGTVIFAGIYSGSLSKSTYIIIAGDDGTYHRLVHIDTITVKVDDKVSVGQEIAKMGKEGAEHVHLHYEVYKNKKEYDDRTAIDPRSLHPEITFTLDIKEKT
jgi:murein DD-endopeptidase MepM/ murein hydrolase activator NlpD